MKTLFIGPLNWSNSIWSLVSDAHAKKQNVFIELLGSPLADLKAQLSDFLEHISESDTIIACSFGCKLLLKFIQEHQIVLQNKVILIDDFAPLPDSATITYYIENRKENYASMEELVDMLLDDEEKKDPLYLSLVADTVCKNDSLGYTARLLNHTLRDYMSYLANISNFEQIIKTNVRNPILFTTIPLVNIPYKLISDEDHLLMLKKPNLVLSAMDEAMNL